MREILFRAKRIDNGEWVEGYYCKRKHYCFDKRTDDLKTVIITEFSSGGFVCYEVNPNTICQYTGLTDKNGNKIWENNIIRFDDCSNYPVFWDSDYNAFGSCYYSDFDHLSKYRYDKLEVVGNIFDNPELVGGAI